MTIYFHSLLGKDDKELFVRFVYELQTRNNSWIFKRIKHLIYAEKLICKGEFLWIFLLLLHIIPD